MILLLFLIHYYLKIKYYYYILCVSLGLNLSGVVCRKVCGANLTMEIAQLLMSLLYAWGLDFEIDKICETKLGLLRPMIPVSFGVISKGGKS